MVYLLFQEAIRDTFHQKYFQNQGKIILLWQENISVIQHQRVCQSVCVLQVEWRFKFISRTDREKYFLNWIKIL